MQYPNMFKNTMIQKMTGQDAISATALSKQINVPQSTLSKWLRMAGVDLSHVLPNHSSKKKSIRKNVDAKGI